MVSSTTAVGGTLRCVTFATKDNLALEKWTGFLEQVERDENRKQNVYTLLLLPTL